MVPSYPPLFSSQCIVEFKILILEAFSKYGLTNITDKYLPQKLELAKSL
jgi:hypothetical protein